MEGPIAAARHHRRLFEHRVQVGEGRRQHEIGRRHQRQSLHEHQAGHRVDVERRGMQAEQLHQPQVDGAVARAQQHRPGDRQQQRRRRHRQQHERTQQAAAGQIGPLDQPGEARAQDQREAGRAQAKEQGRRDQAAEPRIAIGIGIVFEREAGIERKSAGPKAAHHHEHQRHDHEIGQHRTHRGRRPEARGGHLTRSRHFRAVC